MKKSFLCILLAGATTLLADESTEVLRKEFLAY
jgi:hypothetical protein